jgi:hypothetical protein
VLAVVIQGARAYTWVMRLECQTVCEGAVVQTLALVRAHTRSVATLTRVGAASEHGTQVEQYKRQGQELWSFSAGGGSTGHLLAAGGNAQVVLWDRRKGKVAAAWDELHTEAVTQVRACCVLCAVCCLPARRGQSKACVQLPRNQRCQ